MEMEQSNVTLTADPMCIICRKPKAAHVQTGRGLECPVSMYYTPCQHKQTHGWAAIGTAGFFDSESWCDDCGQQIAFKKGAA